MRNLLLEYLRRRKVKKLIRNTWPELSKTLSNLELHERLKVEGLQVDWEAVNSLAKDAGVLLAVSPDNKVRVSEI